MNIGSLIGGAGGGGNIFSSIGGIVGGIFGGPMGAMIGKAVGNMVGQAVGDAVKQTVDTLQKEDGMPKFLVNDIKKMVDERIDSLKDKSVDEDTQCKCNDAMKGGKQDLVEQLVKQLLDGVRQALDTESAKQSGKSGKSGGSGGASQPGGSGAKGGSGGAVATGGAGEASAASGGAGSSSSTSPTTAGATDASGVDGASSWLEAIAKAMGGTLGDKAAKMVKLSKEMARLSKDADTMKNNSDGSKTDAQEKNARDFTMTQTQLQAVSQEFSMLQSSFANAIKSIGEGLAQMGRKG
jgi:hypothetical protein